MARDITRTKKFKAARAAFRAGIMPPVEVVWKSHPHHKPEMGQLLRACLRHEARLAKSFRWTPFPNNECSLSFGTYRRPLPVGALFVLWKHCPELTTQCGACGGRVLSHSFLGWLSTATIFGVCSQCDLMHTGAIWGTIYLVKLIQPHLKETVFRVTGGGFGYADIAGAQRLCRVLYKLGERDLPPDEWINKKLVSHVRLEIGGVPAAIKVPIHGKGGDYL